MEAVSDGTEEYEETDIEGEETEDCTGQYDDTEEEHNEGDIDGEEFEDCTDESNDKDEYVETGEVEQYEEGSNEDGCLLGAGEEDYTDQYNDYCDDFDFVENDEDYSNQYSDYDDYY